MKEPETYALPVEKEVIETSFPNETALEILETAAEYEEETTLTELSNRACQEYVTTIGHVDRFEDAGLLERIEQVRSKTYQLSDKGRALSALYSKRGIEAFPEVMTQSQRLLNEVEENDGKIHSSEVSSDFSGATLKSLEDDGKLEVEKLNKGSLYYLPDIDISEEDRLEAMKKGI